MKEGKKSVCGDRQGLYNGKLKTCTCKAWTIIWEKRIWCHHGLLGLFWDKYAGGLQKFCGCQRQRRLYWARPDSGQTRQDHRLVITALLITSRPNVIFTALKKSVWHGWADGASGISNQPIAGNQCDGYSKNEMNKVKALKGILTTSQAFSRYRVI